MHFLPGGTQTIAKGDVPGAAGYSIRAQRYRFQHRTYFNLAANVQEIGGGSQATNFTPNPSKPFAWSTEQGCSPSASMWTVVFGLLASPRDRAYAYTAHGRHRLRTAVIPRRFRAGGVAAYVALSEQPVRMLVTNATGAILVREKLEVAPHEYCPPGAGIMIFSRSSHGKTG
ncbi:MAG: hypothetical protein ACYDHN_11915 [Solirubrobacteraceae bacterium]